MHRTHLAGVGAFKPLCDFDWAWPKGIDRAQLEDLFSLRFIAEGENVILVGPNGVGKTMILRNLAHSTLHAGLQAAHAAHILHRDLKPQNIFLVERVGCTALVELVDFGLARNLSQSDATQLTRPGRRCGTVQYMSPEQLRGQPLDQRSDVFSVGVLLYETLSGRHPFAASTAVELRTNILRGTPAPLQTMQADIPNALAATVAWAMASLPEHRPSSAVELQRALLAATIGSNAPSGALPSDDPGEPEPASITSPVWAPPDSSG